MVLAAVPALCCCAQEPESAADTPPTEVRAAAPAITLEAWLDTLAVAESGNRQRLVHRDRDGQLYYGCLQFNARTFRVNARKFHLLPKGSREETMRRIYDCKFQKRLAALMLRNDPGSWRNWKYTVEKRVGYPPTEAGASAPPAAESETSDRVPR